MASAIELLTSHLGSAEIQHGVQQEFWRLEEQVEMRVYVRMTACDGATYLLELECTGYGDEPIAGRFVSEKHECVSSAWPRGDGAFSQWVKFDAPHLFICWPEDRLGIGHHGDWRGLQAWKRHSNQIYGYLDFVRKLLNVPSFGYSLTV